MRLREILRISARDMMALRSLPATTAIVVTVAVLTGVSLAAYGLLLGQHNVAIQRIRNNPLTACLWVGDPHLTRNSLTEDHVRNLEQQVRERLGTSEGFSGCYPFRLVRVEARKAVLPSEKVKLVGRTMRIPTGSVDGDPILRSIGLDYESGFSQTDASGVVITPGCLSKLGWIEEQAYPTVITLLIDGQPQAVKILGIAKRDLPYGLDFLMPEKLDEELLRLPKQQKASEVLTGAAPKSWHDALRQMFHGKGPAGEVWQHLEKQGVSGGFDEETSQLVLFVSESDALTLADWTNMAARIALAIAEATKVNGDSFVGVNPSVLLETENDSTARHVAYDMAGFYFSDLSGLPVAASVADADHVLRGCVDTRVVKQLSAADRATKSALKIVTTFEIMIVIMALTNLLVVHFFRAAWQRREAGMLRACGMPGSNLLCVVLTQGTLAWTMGVAIGLLSGWQFGELMSRWQYPQPAEAIIGFEVTAPILLAVIITPLVFCWICSLVCTANWHLADPARLLDES